MSSFPIYATSPLPYAVLVLIVLVLAWHWLPGGVRYAGIVIEILLFMVMTPLGADALARTLEARIPPAQACPAPEPRTVVVLGGGFEHAPRSPDDFGALHLVTLQRLFAAVALWRRIPGARLVISGGAGSLIRESQVMGNLALVLGVPATSIELEDRSRNTWQNAENVAALSPRVPERIWLVSSTMHLPRALGAFRAWGFKPCAWPTDRKYANVHIYPGAFVPQGAGVRTAAVALHEMIGGVEYSVRAWRHAREVRAAPHRTP